MTSVPAGLEFAIADALVPETGAQPADEIKTFVAAIAVVLRETVAGFEETVARITDITVPQSGRADRDLVVALQDFDRLQQEFAMLSEVLTKLSAMSPDAGPITADPESKSGDQVLAVISVADLKDRLGRHLRSLMLDVSASKVSEETIF